MRLLVDNALSPRVSRGLSDAGHDVVHVRDVGLATSSDDEIIDFASEEDRVVVSADTDFATILALRQAAHPSFILLRGDIERWPEAQTALLVGQLSTLEEALTSGAVIVVTRDRIRIRSLPILPE